jgi:hypothetical protein
MSGNVLKETKMMTKTDSVPTARDVWYFPAVGAAVVCSGIYLHLTRLFLDAQTLVEKIYTPNFDLAFFIPMLFVATCMPIFWSRVKSESRWRNIFYWVMVAYFWISVPIHLRAQIRQSTDFVFAFPAWYSLVMLPWLGLQVYFFVTIAIRPHQFALAGARLSRVS